MCGRFTLTTGELGALRGRLGLDERLEVRRRYNVAPGDDVLAVTPAGARELRWGFLRDSAYTTINARAESLVARPTWREALHDGRCLILADGFYEWQRTPGAAPQAHWITRSDHAPFAFAGLASTHGTCAIVTTAATPRLAPLHDRMPVILDPGTEVSWLDPDTSAEEAQPLLAPFADTVAVPVGPAVNDARIDGPECLEPAPAPAPTLF